MHTDDVEAPQQRRELAPHPVLFREHPRIAEDFYRSDVDDGHPGQVRFGILRRQVSGEQCHLVSSADKSGVEVETQLLCAAEDCETRMKDGYAHPLRPHQLRLEEVLVGAVYLDELLVRALLYQLAVL